MASVIAEPNTVVVEPVILKTSARKFAIGISVPASNTLFLVTSWNTRPLRLALFPAETLKVAVLLLELVSLLDEVVAVPITPVVVWINVMLAVIA